MAAVHSLTDDAQEILDARQQLARLRGVLKRPRNPQTARKAEMQVEGLERWLGQAEKKT